MQEESPDRFPVRKSPRIPNFDYGAPNCFFVTICTHDKRCIFGEPGKLSRQGLIAERGLKEIPLHFPQVTVDAYVVMPNHIHAIIINNQPGTPLPIVIAGYKSFVTREIRLMRNELKVWQTSFHDHVIRNQQDYEKIWKYIDENPLRWEEDCFHVDQ